MLLVYLYNHRAEEVKKLEAKFENAFKIVYGADSYLFTKACECKEKIYNQLRDEQRIDLNDFQSSYDDISCGQFWLS